MPNSDSVNENVAVIIEQYVDRTEARLPGMGGKWVVAGTTPDEALNPLLSRLRHDPPSLPSLEAPVAVSLLTIPPDASGLRPPMLVYAPEGIQALFNGPLDPMVPPPPEAIWLKPRQPVPDDAADGTVFVLPRRMPPFRANHVIIRSHHGGRYQLLHHDGGAVIISPSEYSLYSRVHRLPEAQISVRGTSPIRERRSPNRLPVIVEQYRDHAESYLPGMGSAWHTTDVTPDGALAYLTQLISRYHPAIASPTTPVAVSLITARPGAFNLRPASVEQGPTGAMVLFSGGIAAPEPQPPDVVQLEPGDPIPAELPYGRAFFIPPSAKGLDDEGHCPPDAVVIHLPPGTGHQVLGHSGPVVIKYPARLVRITEGLWGKLHHEEHPTL